MTAAVGDSAVPRARQGETRTAARTWCGWHQPAASSLASRASGRRADRKSVTPSPLFLIPDPDVIQGRPIVSFCPSSSSSVTSSGCLWVSA